MSAFAANSNWIEAVRPSLTFLVMGTVWSSFLIPIALALFFFSTSASRKRPIFILNVISIGLGLLQGALNIYNQTRAILGLPLFIGPDIVYLVTTNLVPIFAESILLIRVIAVYPPRTLPLITAIAIYTPVVVFKVARLINIIMYMVWWIRAVGGKVDNILLVGQEAWGGAFYKIEVILGLLDMSYTSALFVFRLGSNARERNQILQSDGSYSARLKALFWIAVSNFVFPCLLNLVVLIFMFRDPNFLNGTYVYTVSTYVQIIGVILATIWCNGTSRYGSDDEGSRRPEVTSIQFAFSSRETGDASLTESIGSRGSESLHDKC